MPPPVLFETERLCFRGWHEDDIPAFAALIADPEVMRHIGDGQPKTTAEATFFVHEQQRLAETRGWIRWAVVHKPTGTLMGFCGYGVFGEELDFGWRYARPFWGQGYGTEAARAVLAYGRATYGFARVKSMAFVENAASIRIMEKIGMTFERHLTLFGRAVAVYVMED